MVIRFGVVVARQERLFPVQEDLDVLLGYLIHQPFDSLAILDPLANRVVESLGDVRMNPPVTVARVKIECRMLLSLFLTAAVGFAA
jgi:hypothetical protein